LFIHGNILNNMTSSGIKKIAYSVLSLVTRNKGIQRTINHFKVKFPARWSRYYESDYEKDNYDFLRGQVKPGMHIIDIGAHFGLFSVVSSQLTGSTGKIVCFEPTPGTYSVLIQTLKLNHCNNVIPVQAAVSDKEGTAIFYVSEIGGCNSNSLVEKKTGKETKGYEVKLFTIDTITQEYLLNPGLIKIDAEGAEFDVLKGGLNTFQKFRPILILGLHPDFINQKGDSLEKIWDLLQQAGYRVKENETSLAKSDFCGRTLLFDVHCTM
jgi:FkbM family methyltransferase